MSARWHVRLLRVQQRALLRWRWQKLSPSPPPPCLLSARSAVLPPSRLVGDGDFAAIEAVCLAAARRLAVVGLRKEAMVTVHVVASLRVP